MLWIGSRQNAPDSPVRLPPAVLLRHAMALGSSGSGKTVFCKVLVEEAVRQRIPVIAVDPQGDLCSLALQPPPFPGESAAATEYRERADVVIFTPAARKGVPLCADPVNGAAARLAPTEQLLAFSRTAGRIVSLLGYDLDGGDGPGLVAVIDRVLH